ncbi:hypothetical protein [Alteriqipengyuania sp.]|uniref:hypothetical protein n=1 Tax=Alteriqipengyuania sp. TaxID=2800692 RepID=UPI003516D06F
MIRVKMPALDRLALLLEKRALRRLDHRSITGRSGSDHWRSPAKLWPHFGDD